MKKFQMSNFKCPISNKRLGVANWKLQIGNCNFASGFTLIEVIVVIAIIGIIAASLVATINPFEQIKKSNDTKRKADIAQIQRALELYYQDHGQYPQSSAAYQIVNQVGNTSTPVAWGSSWQPYMHVVPADPLNSHSYVYFSTGNGQTYYLYASLERGSYDPGACNKGDACTSLSGGGFPPATACGSTCNYGVSSPNVIP